jgi:F-type H+-transporting ATPase subunit delta
VTELSREYGEGLYLLCAEEELAAEVFEQLTALRALFRENPDFSRLVSNHSLSKQERVTILDNALRGQVHQYVLNFLKILCERGIFGEFANCVDAYTACYHRDHRVVEAVATTGVPLSDAQRSQLMEKLRSMTGKQVQLTEKVDPAVLGGVLLEMEGKRYDNTLKHRLGQMRQVLTSEV